MNKKLKILIYRHGSIGDTVMALPCFHKIRECYPEADITLLTNRPFTVKEAPLESILGPTYFFDRTLAYPGATRNPLAIIRLLIQLWLLNINLVIDLTVSQTPNRVSRDLLFFKLAGIKHFIGFPTNNEHLDLLLDPLTGLVEWEAKRLARRISSLGKINLSSPTYWDLRLSGAEHREATRLLQALPPHKQMLAISLGTKATANDWGLTNWLALMDQLSYSLHDWLLIIIGSEDEAQVAELCLSNWKGVGLNLCGRTTARVSATILEKATLFVGHDSGPMHLAGCVGTPCVAIFSARNLPGQWFPRGEHNQLIYHETDCAGCGLVQCVEQKKKCILSISVQEVEAAILQVAAFV